ncbi:MAG: hypothetical protein RLZZ306_2939 [Bacteroidota bacterium]|jgi:uncharacterized phage-associated protein
MKRGFNYRKSVQALNYLAEKFGGSLNKMKALKLIWLADRLHVRRYGRSITGDVYFAMPFGPVPSTTRDLVESYQSLNEIESEYRGQYIANNEDKYVFQSLTKPNLKVFSKTDIEVIDEIVEKFGQLKEFELSNFSHIFPEWTRYESELKSKNSSRFEIDYKDFFVNVKDNTNTFIDSDENLEITKELMLENY